MAEKCWWGRWSLAPCTEDGIYGIPEGGLGPEHGKSSILYKSRWCEEHRHPEDVKLTEQQPPSAS